MAVLISCALDDAPDWLDDGLELSDDELLLLADPLLLLQAASMAAETRPMPSVRAGREVRFMVAPRWKVRVRAEAERANSWLGGDTRLWQPGIA